MKNSETWKEIHRLAEELYMLKPWDFMEETDVFGVRTPAGKIYFISIMGSAGNLRAISAYEGAAGLDGFWELENDPTTSPESVLLIPHMTLAFVKEKDIDKNQKEIMKGTGLDESKLKEWPELHRIVPGLLPAVPEEPFLGDFAEIMVQVLKICSRARQDVSFIFPDNCGEDTYLIREPLMRSGKTVWTDKYREITTEPEPFDTVLKKEDIDEMRLMRKVRIVIQAGCRLIPAPVREKEKPDYFPFILLITNKKTGIIEGLETMAPLPDYHSMIEQLPLAMVTLIKRLGFKPFSIEVTDRLLFELLSPEFSLADIKVNLVKYMKTIDKAFESLTASLTDSTR